MLFLLPMILHDANRADHCAHCLIVLRAGIRPKKKRHLSRYPRLMAIDPSNGAAYAVKGDAHLAASIMLIASCRES